MSTPLPPAIAAITSEGLGLMSGAIKSALFASRVRQALDATPGAALEDILARRAGVSPSAEEDHFRGLTPTRLGGLLRRLPWSRQRPMELGRDNVECYAADLRDENGVSMGCTSVINLSECDKDATILLDRWSKSSVTGRLDDEENGPGPCVSLIVLNLKVGRDGAATLLDVHPGHHRTLCTAPAKGDVAGVSVAEARALGLIWISRARSRPLTGCFYFTGSHAWGAVTSGRYETADAAAEAMTAWLERADPAEGAVYTDAKGKEERVGPVFRTNKGILTEHNDPL